MTQINFFFRYESRGDNFVSRREEEKAYTLAISLAAAALSRTLSPPLLSLELESVSGSPSRNVKEAARSLTAHIGSQLARPTTFSLVLDTSFVLSQRVGVASTRHDMT